MGSMGGKFSKSLEAEFEVVGDKLPPAAIVSLARLLLEVAESDTHKDCPCDKEECNQREGTFE